MVAFCALARPARKRCEPGATVATPIDANRADFVVDQDLKRSAGMSPLLAAFVFTAGFFSTLFLLARWELKHHKQ